MKHLAPHLMTDAQILAELESINRYQLACSSRCVGSDKFNRLSQRSNELRAFLRVSDLDSIIRSVGLPPIRPEVTL